MMLTFVANLKEDMVSSKASKAGLTFTNINALLFPPK